MIRNTIAVLLGLLIAIAVITLSVMLDSHWIKYDYKGLPIEHWRSVMKTARPEFFVALLVSSGIGSLLGGVVCALIVKHGKRAYAMLIGFILFIIAIVDGFIFKGHPIWYKIAAFFIFFPFSWLGAQVVVRLQRKKV
ncbi:MAG: hypothetical protein LBT29_02885 [Flavobacteriaceae bacterium]|jgi:predicted MFS family arabinose efflux permease|nr:hypothetical protein [Flavobacteriaceae bacterium]